MKTTRSRSGKSLWWLAALLLLAFLPPSSRADDTPSASAAGPGDPPSRVARISFIDGTVSFQSGGQGDWGSAAMNRPVTVGDKIWSDKSSRAELQAGQASIHMGSMTALSFLNLDESIMQVRLAEGAINFRVREMREGDVYEVDTPNSAFTVKQAGAFRIDVSETGDATAVTVIRGEGEVTAGGKTYPVHAGDRAEFTGVDNPQYQLTAAPSAPDGLDRWSAERDLRDDNSTSSKYVSPDIPGRADLDDNGEWSEQPDYGPVWYPNEVGPDWAPYSNGYWNYVGPWGWTWIGYEPWGFAPYHYGRWAFIGSRWGWCPGPIYARPFYGPAFVGFLGGAHFGIGFGGGFGVGWFPLGFHEPYYPGFRCSRVFINNINIRNTTIHNVNVLNSGGRGFNYAYAHNTRAVTATSRNAFVGGQSIHRSSAHLTEASLRGAEVSNHSSFAPTRQSSFGAAHATARATPPSSVQSRAVVARTSPAASANSPVHLASTSGMAAGRSSIANRTPQTTARSNQFSQGRPPSANTPAATNQPAINSGARPNSSARTWAAQGNSTDRGTPPQGFGSSSRIPTNPGNSGGTQTPRGATRTDRPPWAGSASHGAIANGSTSARSTSSNGNRAYQPPSRSNSQPNRNYQSQPASRSYEPASRSYSPPARSYSAPRSSYPSSRPSAAPSNHSAPAPSHSSGGGGGSHGGGGGGSHGGGHH
jgi:hypothetical protein